MSVVLKKFPYSSDGFTIVHLVPGDELDFGDSTESLVKEGFIGAKKSNRHIVEDQRKQETKVESPVTEEDDTEKKTEKKRTK